MGKKNKNLMILKLTFTAIKVLFLKKNIEKVLVSNKIYFGEESLLYWLLA